MPQIARCKTCRRILTHGNSIFPRRVPGQERTETYCRVCYKPDKQEEHKKKAG